MYKTLLYYIIYYLQMTVLVTVSILALSLKIANMFANLEVNLVLVSLQVHHPLLAKWKGFHNDPCQNIMFVK